MPRRYILSARQRSAMLDLPRDEASMLRRYILADDDLIQIDRRHRPENRIGFALQLCALRYPVRMLAPVAAIERKELHRAPSIGENDEVRRSDRSKRS